jgi:tripartite-type tricarboxylate transporter receptor subunit TctC
MTIEKLLKISLSAYFFLCVTLDVSAAEFPTEKPIRMVVGFTAGGAADKLARPVAERMSKYLGQTELLWRSLHVPPLMATQFI